MEVEEKVLENILLEIKKLREEVDNLKKNQELSSKARRETEEIISNPSNWLSEEESLKSLNSL